MLYISPRPYWAGGLNISGVDVIVYSWFKGLAGTSMWRISVNNVRAFVVLYEYQAPKVLEGKIKITIIMSYELQKALEHYLSMQPLKDDPYHPMDQKRLFNATYLAWKEHMVQSEFVELIKNGLIEHNKFDEKLFGNCRNFINSTYTVLRLAQEFDLLK